MSNLIRRRMRKQKADTLTIVRPPDGLRQRRTNIHNPQSLTPLLLISKWNSVCDNHSAQLTLVECLDCVAAQDTVGYDRYDLSRAVVHDCFCGFDKRATRIGHVVDENGDFVLDVTYEYHAGDFIGAGALFVN